MFMNVAGNWNCSHGSHVRKRPALFGLRGYRSLMKWRILHCLHSHFLRSTRDSARRSSDRQFHGRGAMPGKDKRAFAILLLLAAAISLSSLGCGGAAKGTGLLTPGSTPGPNPTPTPTSNPIPSAVSMSPNIMTAPGPGITFLKVNGSGFVLGSVVQWNGSGRATTFVNSSQLTALIGASDVATAGQAAVTVSNPSPGGGTSGALAFRILAPIVFASNRALDGSNAAATTYNIWITRDSRVVPLTNLSKLNTDSTLPAWSRDGRKIAFMSRRALDGSDTANPNLTNNIWVMNADGSGALALTRMTAVSSFFPHWSPDGSKIAFESARVLTGGDAADANVTYNIWVVNADGSGATALTKLTAKNASSFSPVWSPDGSGKIVFHSMRALSGSDAANTNDTFNIWVANADGSGETALTQLTAKGADSFSPVWSPDGSKIAFLSTRALDGSDASNTNSTTNIWVMNADGSGATAVTRMITTGVFTIRSLLVWSPDGSKITFESPRALDGSDAANTNSTANIWVVNADGSGAAALTRFTAANAFASIPVWSPDGERIAFVANTALDGSNTVNTNGAVNLWVINADGTGAIPLTRLTAPSVNPVFPGVDTDDPEWQP